MRSGRQIQIYCNLDLILRTDLLVHSYNMVGQLLENILKLMLQNQRYNIFIPCFIFTCLTPLHNFFFIFYFLNFSRTPQDLYEDVWGSSPLEFRKKMHVLINQHYSLIDFLIIHFC